MTSYIFFLLLMGVTALLSAWLPPSLKKSPLSLPMICVGLGLLAAFAPVGWRPPVPGQDDVLIEKVTELCVLFSLAGAGLGLERELGWAQWRLPRRLIFVTMPLTILALTALGHAWLGLPMASALLLAAVLSPTDPVLASDVQVEGPASQESEHTTRFALTAEAGLNDGLAFPFTVAAIALAAHGGQWGGWLGEWFLVDVLYRIIAAGLIGCALGALIARVSFEYVECAGKLAIAFVSVGFTLVTYACCEVVHAYGFLGVFVAALMVRRSYRHHRSQEDIHELAAQFEHIMMGLILLVFGAMVGHGILGALSWQGGVFALVAIFVVRPLAGWLGLLGQQELAGVHRIPASFLGIRGIGSFYYLAYATHKQEFMHPEVLWAIASATVLLSIVAHGASATYLVGRYGKG